MQEGIKINEIVYLLFPVSCLGILALYFLNKARAVSIKKAGTKLPFSAKDFLVTRKKELDGKLYNQKLIQQFRDAGNPWGITGLTYQYLRYGSVFLYFMFSLPAFLLEPSLGNLLNILLKVGLLFGLSMPGEYFPITMLLGAVKNYQAAEKNRELFMLYTLIADEIKAAKENRDNLYSALTEMRNYVILIRPAIERAILNWNKGTNKALEIMALEIGTPEADELAKILADLEECDADKANQLLMDRQQTFIQAQTENKRRRLKTIGQLGYVTAFVPVILYGWNMMGLVMMEVDFLSDFTNLK